MLMAAMLEMARTLQGVEFIPKRTIVFAALDDGGGYQFVGHPPMPTGRSEIWTVVILQGIGASEARLARVESGPGLARAFDQSARRIGVGTDELDEWPFFSATYNSRMAWRDPRVHQSYQSLAVTRLGDERSGTPADTVDRMDPEQLAEAGQAATHFVMVVSYR